MQAFGLLMYGFSVLLTWKILALMMVGLVLGIFVGVLPGLGGPNGVAILLPLTFTMDSTSAIVMLSCIYWWRAVRRRHHLNPVQHSRRSGRDHLRRLSDGAAGQGGGSADCGLHLILHRFAGRGAADHAPGADDLVVRAEIRTTGNSFRCICSPSAPLSASASASASAAKPSTRQSFLCRSEC